MSGPKKTSLREQLIEAQANVRRQISVLSSGPNYGRGSASWGSGIDELNATLGELTEALASLGPDDD